MKLSILLLLAVSLSCFSQGYQKTSQFIAAELLYKNKEKEKAKALYFEAAELGDVHAQYALWGKFHIDKEVTIPYLQKASEKGYSKALKSYFNAVFFRSDSFEYSNPQMAMQVYKKAKSFNPKLKLYKEEETVKVISKCTEAPTLNRESFLKKYNADISDSPWLWARNISEREVNPGLVFSLVCLGGIVPMEKISAVNKFYKYWKENKNVKFHGCDYASSNYTMAICSRNERF